MEKITLNRRFSMNIFAIIFTLFSIFFITSCSQVKVPNPGPLAELSLDGTDALIPERKNLSQETLSLNEQNVVPPLPAIDSTMIYGFKVTPELHSAMRAFAKGEPDRALKALDKADTSASGSDPVYRWYLSAYRAHVLNLSGRASEGEAQAERSAALELAIVGSDMMAWVLRGDARVRLGEFDQAASDYLTVVKALGGWKFPTSYSGVPTNIAELTVAAEAKTRAFLGLAFLHTMQSEYDRALPWGETLEEHISDILAVKADELYGSVIGELHPDLILARAVNLTFLGAGQIVIHRDPDAARPHFTAAQRFFDSIGFRQGKAYILTLKAKALNDAGFSEAAFKLTETASAEAKARGLLDFVWRVQFIKGKSLLSLGRKTEAEHAFREAQKSVDAITGIISTDRDKRRFGIGKDDVTRQLASLTFDRGEPSVLFDDLERGRARAFVDLLASVRRPKGVGEEALIEIHELTQRVRDVSLRRELATPGISGQLLINKVDLQTLVIDRSKKVKRLARRNPRLAETLGVSSSSLAGMQSALSPDDLLVYYLPAQDDLPIRSIEITQDEVKLSVFNLTGSELRTSLVDFLAAGGKANAYSQKQLADTLSSILKVERFTTYKAVYVVPSGNLHFVPWGALAVETPISVLPTGSWLMQSHNRQQSSSKAVVVGDPYFDGKLPQLPGARDEAKTVAALYGVSPLIGKNASESAVRAASGEGVDILHFATHAKFDADDPLESTLVLAKKNDDMFLTARDIFESPIKARLVVLSACETGVGEAQAGDDFLGLPRSFYLAGASSVLSSLWPVEDEGTKIFMTTFHQNLKSGKHLGRAWLNARNKVRSAGMGPWVYGAFVLGGRQD
jgi:CHAT domain-containing protein/tetratricopeptide (TPR) repeat protein